jgi:uncharacterized damage-inducible protein DinB
MTLAASLLPEFDHEMANTRRVLERVPLERGDWRPHPKSRPLAGLAHHLAQLAGWGALIFESPELDLAGPRAVEPERTAVAPLLADFDGRVAATRAALAAASDEAARAPWTLRAGDHALFTLPRLVAVRSVVISHMIHHRAQLTLYLRLLDVPVPGLYGPSADEV